MVFAYLAVVLFVLICKANRITPEDCSAAGVYSGIARNRDNMLNAKTEILYSAHPPFCDGGVQCKQFCSIDSTEWNFFELRKVSPLLLYGLIQESHKKIVCCCYNISAEPQIQPSSLWYYGFIYEGTSETGCNNA